MNKEFFQLLDFFEKFAEEQQMLPGFSEEDAPLPARPEGPFRFERNIGPQIDLTRQKSLPEPKGDKTHPPKKIYESDYDYSGQTIPAGGDDNFRLPSSGIFPELTLDNINSVIETKESALRRLRRHYEELRSRLDFKSSDNLNELHDTDIKLNSSYEKEKQRIENDLYLSTAEEALKVYSTFREKYKEYYRSFRIAASKLDLGIDEEDIYKKILSLPLEEGLELVPQVIVAKAKKAAYFDFANNNSVIHEIFQQPAEGSIGNWEWVGGKAKYKINTFRSALVAVNRSLNKFTKVVELLKGIDNLDFLENSRHLTALLSNDKKVKEEIVYNLRESDVADIKNSFHSILADIIDRNIGSDTTYNKQMFNKDLTSRFVQTNIDQKSLEIKEELKFKFSEQLHDKIANIYKDIDSKWNQFDSNARKTVINYINNKNYLLSQSDNKPSNVIEKINKDIDRDKAEIEKLYSIAREAFKDYFDFNKIEKMFNLGILHGINMNQIDPDDKDRLAFNMKANIVLGTESYTADWIDDRYTREANAVAHNFINESINKKSKSKEEIEKELDSMSSKFADKAVGWSFLRHLEGTGTSVDIDVTRKEKVLESIPQNLSNIYMKTEGKFGPLEVAQIIKDKFKGIVDDKVVEGYISLCLKNKDFNRLINLLYDKSQDYYAFRLASEILKKKGNLNATSLYDAVKNSAKNIVVKIYNLFKFLPENIDINEKLEIIGQNINSISEAEFNSDQIYKTLSDIHNYSKDLDKDSITKILNNSNSKNLKYNIPKKIHESIIKVLGAGGVERFINDNKEAIEYLISKGAISNDFKNNLQKFIELYKSEDYVKISNPSYSEYSSFINSVYKDINTALNYNAFKSHYETASKPESKKNPELFKLNYQINDYLRFRVLKDLDPQYFNVGIETDCCQSVGGAGEEAAVDSFVNPMAAVVVLEINNNGDWETVAQSYFHYVPGGGRFYTDGGDKHHISNGGYILDNVEVANKYSNGIVTPAGNNINIEEIYAYWASKKKEELGISYIQSGTGYSDISSDMFKEIYTDEDPRSFSVDDPYTDWDSGDNIDLFNFDGEIGDLSKVANNISNLSKAFYKSAAPIQEDLRGYLKENPSQYQTMEQIDTDSFAKYEGSFGQDAEDIEDDFSQPGAGGVGLTDDNGDVLGYVYGYNMTKDELPDIDKDTTTEDLVNEYGVKFFTSAPSDFYKNFLKTVKNKKVFYISNLALPTSKIKLASMLKKLIENLKSAGYRYVTFDALSDSMNLFMGDGLEPKQKRLDHFGVNIIAIIPDGSGYSHAQTLVELK